MAEQEKKELNEIIKMKDKELLVLYRLDEIIDLSTTLQQFLDLLLKEVINFMQAKMGCILLRNGKTGRLEVKAVNRKAKSVFADEQYSSVIKISNRSVKRGTTEILSGSTYLKHIPEEIKSVIAAPMIIEENVIGSIVVMNKKKGEFQNADLQIMKAIVSQTDSAIVHMQLQDKMMQKLQMLEIISEVDSIRDETTNVEELLVKVLDSLRRYIPTEYSAAININEKRTISNYYTLFTDACCLSYTACILSYDVLLNRQTLIQSEQPSLFGPHPIREMQKRTRHVRNYLNGRIAAKDSK